MEEEKERYSWLRKYQWPKGVSGNPNGRPKGLLSPKDKIRIFFEDNPEAFEEFLTQYMEDKRNAQHIVELFEGKPKQAIDLSVPQNLIDLIKNAPEQGTSQSVSEENK